MPDMNATSASLYGSRPSPLGVACRPDRGALAHPAASAATDRHAATADRETVLMRPPADASYAIFTGSGLPEPIHENAIADARRIGGPRRLEGHEPAVGGHDRVRRLASVVVVEVREAREVFPRAVQLQLPDVDVP